jgi:hypothetical protein
MGNMDEYYGPEEWDTQPSRCSDFCRELGGSLGLNPNGQIDKPPEQARAIRDARRSLAEVLDALQLTDAFKGRHVSDIDRVIEACVSGYEAAMRQQAAGREL